MKVFGLKYLSTGEDDVVPERGSEADVRVEELVEATVGGGDLSTVAVDADVVLGAAVHDVVPVAGDRGFDGHVSRKGGFLRGVPGIKFECVMFEPPTDRVARGCEVARLRDDPKIGCRKFPPVNNTTKTLYSTYDRVTSYTSLQYTVLSTLSYRHHHEQVYTGI